MPSAPRGAASGVWCGAGEPLARGSAPLRLRLPPRARFRPLPPAEGARCGPAPRLARRAEVRILDRLAFTLPYRRIALTVFVLTTAVMMIQGYTNIKLFQARAQLLIEDERSTAVPGLNSAENTFYEDPEPYYNTQFRILKGRDLTRRVVRRLKLETVPEFNGTATPPPTPVSMIRDFQTRLMALVRKPAAAPPQEAPKVDETPDESALVSAFIGRVGVEPIRGSRLVDVTFMSADPNFAALAANTLVDEYVEQNLAIKLESSQNMLDWLAKELEKQQQKVQESEQALADLPRQAERDVARRQAEHRHARGSRRSTTR